MTRLTKVVTSDTAVKRALFYLRVSTKRQMDTAVDINPEGNSIPTQRLACQRKAKDNGMVVIDEYVEPGSSATAIAKRPVFQQMLRRIMRDRDVDCVIVYQMSRVFRNATEALMTKAQLRQIGVELISATEDFGSGYLADAMEGVMAIFNELQVRASGEDIKVKMLNKARSGGTNGKAKLGYLNAAVSIDGHKVNTIAIDEQRAKFVILAFELMASGRYANVEQLRGKLTDAGLRMPNGQPVSMQTMHKLLRDKYYMGVVTYKGMEYPGHHEPLITEELFNRVQRVMDTHQGAGSRSRTHHHYLKGVIWCARCKQRFMIQRTRNRHDPTGEYYYFFCGGREDKTCDQPYIAVEAIEAAIEDHYAVAVWLPAEFRDQVRAVVDAAVLSNYELTDELREQYTKRLANPRAQGELPARPGSRGGLAQGRAQKQGVSYPPGA